MWLASTVVALAAFQVCALAVSLQEALQKDTIPLRLQSHQRLRSRSLSGAGIASVAYSDDKQLGNFHKITRTTGLRIANRSYYVVLQVGGIHFRAALDTGSADLWLMSSACSTHACSMVPRYPLAHESPSFVSVNNNSTAFIVQYADGTGMFNIIVSLQLCTVLMSLVSAASGFVARESVQFSNLTIADQALGLCNLYPLLTSGLILIKFRRSYRYQYHYG
jgi:hypothetical protein